MGPGDSERRKSAGEVRPERMRLFFALWPSPQEQGRFLKAAQELEPSVSGRWIARENLHLTLVFLPSVEPEAIGSLFSLVDRARLPKIRLRLDRLLLQPAGREGLLWLVPDGPSQELSQLFEFLQTELLALGLASREERSFIPHITLARRVVLPHRSRSGRKRPVPLRSLVPPVDWAARELALVSSETLPEGSRYTPLASWALPGSA